jgi:hypothetical protein
MLLYIICKTDELILLYSVDFLEYSLVFSIQLISFWFMFWWFRLGMCFTANSFAILFYVVNMNMHVFS